MMYCSCTTVYANTKVPPVVRKVHTMQKVVALTFDDGPSVTFTPQILTVLKKYNAKATFFVIGSRVHKYAYLVQQELSLRNEVANHTYDHVVVTHQSAKRIRSQIATTQTVISSLAQRPQPRLFRPPGGHYDKKLLRIAKDNGFTVVLWSIDSRDHMNPGTRRIVKHVLSDVKAGDIILFHDQGGSRKQTVEALKQIIPKLQRNGYRFVTVSELLRMGK
jgi:peptidoglycan-N-acetylglucosamine deacetylase